MIIIKILFNAAAIYLTAYLLESISLPDFTTALVVALVLGLINLTIKPVIKFLTLPLNILTLGLLGLVINGAFLYLSAYLVEGFTISSFWWAVLAAVLITFLTTLFTKIFDID